MAVLNGRYNVMLVARRSVVVWCCCVARSRPQVGGLEEQILGVTSERSRSRRRMRHQPEHLDSFHDDNLVEHRLQRCQIYTLHGTLHAPSIVVS